MWKYLFTPALYRLSKTKEPLTSIHLNTFILTVDILYEDDYILCVAKPNNMVVHHAYHSRYVAEETSLLQLLLKQFGHKFYPIHRLDRRTSGVILMAKEKSYVAIFQKLFTENAIHKIYFGVVRGHSPDDQIINSPVKGKDADVYKDAETHIKTKHRVTLNIPVKPYDQSRYSLVELMPKTGRLHQLRIHMKKINHPLIGDTKYGDKNHNLMYEKNFGVTHLFLHAYSLVFNHPKTQEKLVLKAPFPEVWHPILQKFNNTL